MSLLDVIPGIRFERAEASPTDRLRAHALEANLTNQALADALGVTQPTVSRWLAGRTQPYARHRAAITRFLAGAA